MNITPDEARVALHDIQHGTAKARNIDNLWAYHLLLWGFVWTVGFLATQVQLHFAGWIWGGVLVTGMVGSAIIGSIQGRSARPAPGTQTAFISTRSGIFHGVLFAFVVLWLIVFRLTAMQIGLLWITAIGFGNVVVGTWTKARLQIVFGASLTLVNVLGYLLLPSYFWLWAAIFAGLPLVVLSLYYLLRKS